MARVPLGLSSAAVTFLFGIVLVRAVRVVRAQAQAPSPASDRVSIDQGIAYVLMLLALVLTYLIHGSTPWISDTNL